MIKLTNFRQIKYNTPQLNQPNSKSPNNVLFQPKSNNLDSRKCFQGLINDKIKSPKNKYFTKENSISGIQNIKSNKKIDKIVTLPLKDHISKQLKSDIQKQDIKVTPSKKNQCFTFKEIVDYKNHNININEQKSKTPKYFSDSQRKILRYSSANKLNNNLIGLRKANSNNENDYRLKGMQLGCKIGTMCVIKQNLQSEGSDSVNKSQSSPRQLDMGPSL